MAQHFLLSRAAKTLSLAQVFQMKDAQAEMAFRRIRWADTNGEPVCPNCGSIDAYDCRRLKGAPRFRCKGCKKDFSITAGTLFASAKLPLRCYLAAIAIFSMRPAFDPASTRDDKGILFRIVCALRARQCARRDVAQTLDTFKQTASTQCQKLSSAIHRPDADVPQ